MGKKQELSPSIQFICGWDKSRNFAIEKKSHSIYTNPAELILNISLVLNRLIKISIHSFFSSRVSISHPLGRPDRRLNSP